MENQNSLITELEKALLKVEEKISKESSFDSLKQANDFYNKLLEDGVIKKRGYTLRGVEDSHLFQSKLNSPFK